MSVLTQSLPRGAVPRFRFPPLGLTLIAAAIGLFLMAFLVLPVAMVIFVTFTEPATGTVTLSNSLDFFRSAQFPEASVNYFCRRVEERGFLSL